MSEKNDKQLSISFRVDAGVVEHNNRDFVARNVDKERIGDNITYRCEDLWEFYQKLFGQALADYNASKKRPYQRTPDYYEHIKNGSQRCFCKECKKYYALEPKTREYPEEIRQKTIKTYYAGASRRGVGKVFGFSKANVYNWIKKMAQNPKSNFQFLELDELYWFIGKMPRTETRENTYVMTMVSRLPHQIVGFDVAFDKASERIQKIVDNGWEAKYYCTDGYLGYVDIVYPGKHIRNAHDKSDTFTVEGVNANLRQYIPILRRRSRCFPRKLETLRAVLELFVQDYNDFGIAKMLFRQNRCSNSRELPFYILDFL